MNETEKTTPTLDRIAKVLQELVSHIPRSAEVILTAPEGRARDLTLGVAMKAGAVSAGLALPPGPLGLMTVLPDLALIWRMQAQLVADVAAIYGKTAVLTREQMVYCLFRHAGAQVVRDLVVRVGQRFVVRQATVQVIQRALRSVGIRVTQRLIGKSLSRWVPGIGASAVGVYAWYDTRQVGLTAMELFAAEIEVERGAEH